MPGFTGLTNGIHAGISSPHIPPLPLSQNPTGEPPPQDDITMSPVPSSEVPDYADAWNNFKASPEYQNLLERDPSSFSPYEFAVLHAVYRDHLREVEEEEKRKRNQPKRCGSLIDEVMMSPPPTHQSLPPHSPPSPFPNSVHTPQATPHVVQQQDADAEMVEATGNFTAFADVRCHPYHRSHARGQRLPGSVPKWVKKKASTRTLVSREMRREQMMLEKESEEKDAAGRSRIETKMAELLGRARLYVEEAGGRWDESGFMRQHGLGLQQTAERLVGEEIAHALRKVNEEYFARAAQFIASLCERQICSLAQAEQVAQANVDAVKELDKAIGDLRAELQKLKMRRRHYPDSKVLDDQLREVTAEKESVIQHRARLIKEIRSTMQQPGQDFISAWRSFQVHHGLPPNMWPAGVVPPMATCASLPTHPSCSTSSTTTTPAFTSDELFSSSSSSSPSSPPSFNPPPRVSRPFSYKYLPTSRPRTDDDRLARYESDWNLIRSGELRDGHATFEQMPWPVFFDINKDELDKLNLESVSSFILRHSSRHIAEATAMKDTLKQQLLRLHSDKIVQILPKFVADDRDVIMEASNKVLLCLIEIYKSL